MQEKRLGNLYGENKGTGFAGNVWDTNTVCPCLTTMGGGNRQPMIIAAMRGRNPENPTSRVAGLPTEQRLEPNLKGVSNTLTSVQKDNLVLEPQYRIRKLTPKECWRLMGFTDDDFHKAEAVNSNAQLYKQAGNSIVKDVLMAISKQMLPYEERQIDGISKQVMVDMAVEEEREKMPF